MNRWIGAFIQCMHGCRLSLYFCEQERTKNVNSCELCKLDDNYKIVHDLPIRNFFLSAENTQITHTAAFIIWLHFHLDEKWYAWCVITITWHVEAFGFAQCTFVTSTRWVFFLLPYIVVAVAFPWPRAPVEWEITIIIINSLWPIRDVQQCVHCRLNCCFFSIVCRINLLQTTCNA